MSRMSSPLFDSAVRLHRAGRRAEAEAAFRQILLAEPADALALHSLGIIAAETGRRAEAVDLMRRAVAADPNSANFQANLGVALEAAGDLNAAISAFREALAIDPSHLFALTKLGTALLRSGDVVQSVTAFRQALALSEDSVDALVGLASALIATGEYIEAAQCSGRAVKLSPDFVPAYIQLGHSLKAVGRFGSAEVTYRAALARQPANPLIYGHLANLFFEAGQFDAAAAAFQRVLSLQPNNAEAYSNLGITYKQMGKLADGIAACRAAIKLQPDHLSAHMNLGVMLLSRGDMNEGWVEYEWRLKSPRHKSPAHEFTAPLWEGNDLDGRRILLHTEQGFGDTIQFIRFASVVAARGGHVIVDCPTNLHRLLEGARDVGEVVKYSAPLPPFDTHCALMGLPLLLGTDLTSIPADVPYLTADPDARRRWQGQLDQLGDDLKVGICWGGHPGNANNRRRSIAPKLLARLSSVPGVRLLSLQKGPAAARRGELAEAGVDLIDWTADLRDFADTAALVAGLDLVITVDTSVCHLAGALGKPTWTLLAFAPDWRWLENRPDSPWYPTMRLFRQPRLGDWPAVIAELTEALNRYVANRSRPPTR